MSELFSRLLSGLAARGAGPLAFRLLLQPTVAAVLAIRDGARDARAGRPAFLWQVYRDPLGRRELLREGWRAVSKVFGVALAVDLVFQIIVFHRINPGQAIVIATLLALVPYALLRGPSNRLIRRVRSRRASRRSHRSGNG